MLLRVKLGTRRIFDRAAGVLVDELFPMLPNFEQVGTLFPDQSVLVLIDPSDVPLDMHDRLAAGKAPTKSQYADWYDFLDAKYQEHAGQFRPVVLANANQVSLI